VHAEKRRYRVNLGLSELERRLDPKVFVRVHRSHMVNLDRVVAWSAYDGSRFQITLQSGRTITASRQRSRMMRELAR
jgi:two-component system LytT family response regulator